MLLIVGFLGKCVLKVCELCQLSLSMNVADNNNDNNIDNDNDKVNNNNGNSNNNVMRQCFDGHKIESVLESDWNSAFDGY